MTVGCFSRVTRWGCPLVRSLPPLEYHQPRASMTKYKLEYIWLDGYTPTPNLRGKTQIKEFASFPTLDQLPLWGFDGSSTMQAEGHSSHFVLKAVAVSPGGARTRPAAVGGGGPPLGLRAEAGRGLSGCRAHRRRAGDVRSHDAGRQDA